MLSFWRLFTLTGDRRFSPFALYIAAPLIVALATLIALPLRGVLTLANFTLIYSLIVLMIAIRLGTVPALIASFVSFFSINFFLVQPFYSLSVADPRELLDLFVYLIVATVSGQLAARSRLIADEAQQRAHEQEILYRLTRSFNQLTEKEGVHQALTTALQEDLSARHASILPYTKETIGDNIAVHYFLLQGGEHIYGTLRVAFDAPLTQPQVDLLNSCVSLAATALQRIDLTELARKSQQFEEADKLKTAILHAVSHDLRTPITIIKSSASNLRHLHEHLSPEEESTIAETIENEVDQLDKLVGNLLDMSRLKAGALTLSCQLNSLEEVVGDVAARVWQLTKQERIKLTFPDDMPLVNFDYGLLLQAITNLVDNSLRYEPEHSQIEIAGEVKSSTAVLKIVNHGATIPDVEKELVMEPFYHGSKGRTGLGLPIAKGIIEAHQGQLSVEDTPGGGATFIVSLPIDESQTHETQNSGR